MRGPTARPFWIRDSAPVLQPFLREAARDPPLSYHAAMETIIRRAEQRDLEALGRLGAMLMRAHFAFDQKRFLPPGESAESGYSWFLGTMLDHPDACVFVAEQEGAIAGYIYVQLEPLSWKELRGPAGFIHDVAVREESRRAGVAEKLIEVALEWFRVKNAPRVILWTAAQNAPAQQLFQRIGFRDTMIEMTMELDLEADPTRGDRTAGES